MKNWEIIADNLRKAGWSWGCVSAMDSCGRTIWIADAHRDDGKRFVVRADEKLTAFLKPGSGPSGGTPRGDFCQPWRGQADARLNCRATRPNAIRVSVINDRVDPASGVAMPGPHTPGLERFIAWPSGSSVAGTIGGTKWVTDCDDRDLG